MKSWKLLAPKQLMIEAGVSAPLPDDNWVKVKMEAAAIANTDLAVYNGSIQTRYPIVLGRNGLGVVTEVFSDECSLAKNDKVVIEPFLECGECYDCKSGNPKLCGETKIMGLTADGLFSDFLNLPVSKLHKIPDGLAYEQAVFAEHVATALNTIDKLNLQKGEHVAIMSASKLGFILAQLVNYYQSIPILIDTSSEYLEAARQNDIYYTFNPKEVNLEQEIFAVTGGRLCEKVVFLATEDGSIDTALNLCGQNGTLCLCGFLPVNAVADCSIISSKQITLITCNNGCGYYPSAINLLINKTVRCEKRIGERIKFDELAGKLEQSTLGELKYKCPILEF